MKFIKRTSVRLHTRAHIFLSQDKTKKKKRELEKGQWRKSIKKFSILYFLLFVFLLSSSFYGMVFLLLQASWSAVNIFIDTKNRKKKSINSDPAHSIWSSNIALPLAMLPLLLLLYLLLLLPQYSPLCISIKFLLCAHMIFILVFRYSSFIPFLPLPISIHIVPLLVHLITIILFRYFVCASLKAISMPRPRQVETSKDDFILFLPLLYPMHKT